MNLACLHSASIRHAPPRSAPSRFASVRLALRRSAKLRSASLKSELLRSAWKRSGDRACIARHRFHLPTPDFSSSICASREMSCPGMSSWSVMAKPHWGRQLAP